MKSSISVTIKKELLDELKSSFPNKNRSQVIEEALEFWTAKKKRNQLKKDAKKLSNFSTELKELEDELVGDGLDEL